MQPPPRHRAPACPLRPVLLLPLCSSASSAALGMVGGRESSLPVARAGSAIAPDRECARARHVPAMWVCR
eukprot:4540770-Pleurochrysis_carterae.AAC.1